jgi:ATP synthase protein I
VAITVALEMAVPSLIGWAADSWLGSGPVLVSIGAILGLIVGMMHLVRLAGARAGGQQPRGRRRP